jgi:hypothetical protein
MLDALRFKIGFYLMPWWVRVLIKDMMLKIPKGTIITITNPKTGYKENVRWN